MRRLKKTLVCAIVLIPFAAVVWLTNSDHFLAKKAPYFDQERLYLVNGTSGRVVEITIDDIPYSETQEIVLDLDLYLMTIDSDGVNLFVGGGKTDPQSKTTNGVYKFIPTERVPSLVYDSGDSGVEKIFHTVRDNVSYVIAITRSELVIIDLRNNKAVQKIPYDFHVGNWSFIDGDLLAGLDKTESVLHTISVFSEKTFTSHQNVTELLTVRSNKPLSFEQDGEWYELDKLLIQQLHGREWVKENSKSIAAWPPRAIIDDNGKYLHTSTDEWKSVTYFIYQNRRIGKVRGSIYDMCIY